MKTLKKLKTGFRRFFIASMLLSLSAMAGNWTVVRGQGQSFYLKFIQVRVFDGLDKNGNITAEKYNEKGGVVEIVVQGTAFDICPGGEERLRFNWSFSQNVSQVVPSTGVSASLQALQVHTKLPCTIGLAARSDLTLRGSDGVVNPFTEVESRKNDSNLLFQPPEERGRVFAFTGDGSRMSAVLGVRLRERPDPGAQFAWFEMFIGTPAGTMRYVYLYEIVRGGQFVSDNDRSGNVSGTWGLVCCSGKYTGSVVLTQNGTKITGSFDDGSGIVGEIKGNILTFRRQWPAGIQDYTFELSPDGKTLTGSFSGTRDQSVGVETKLTKIR